MSYRCSRARRTFETQLCEALSELKPLYSIALKRGGGGGARLLAAYYVFAFAQLEVYVKSLVEDTISAVSIADPSLDKWPDLMLGYLLHKSDGLGADYRNYGISENEGAILDKVAQTARKIASWGNGGEIPAALDPADFLDKKKYPSPRNLEQLFRRIGVRQVWGAVNPAGKFDGNLILTSLNDLRTEIAHEGKVPTGFGLADFRDRIAQMRRFVSALDRGVSKELCRKFVTRTSWNSMMA